MVYAIRSYACQDCGAPTRRARHSSDPRVCVECGIQRGVRHAYRRAIEARTRRAILARANAARSEV